MSETLGAIIETLGAKAAALLVIGTLAAWLVKRVVLPAARWGKAQPRVLELLDELHAQRIDLPKFADRLDDLDARVESLERDRDEHAAERIVPTPTVSPEAFA